MHYCLYYLDDDIRLFQPILDRFQLIFQTNKLLQRCTQLSNINQKFDFNLNRLNDPHLLIKLYNSIDIQIISLILLIVFVHLSISTQETPIFKLIRQLIMILQKQRIKNMMKQSQSDYNFKSALVDFNRLKVENSLPYKMQIKLQYLQNKILGREINLQEYKQLPEYQLQSLQQCDKSSQMTLFSSIVKCLSGKQVIVYFKDQKSFIKKQQSFSMWTKCYISCDSSYLYIKKKVNKKTNYYQFKIKQLKVSKKYLEYKGRLCFGLMYEGRKYMLGFEQETACERIFKTLKQLVKENHPQGEFSSNKKVIKSSDQSDKFQSIIVNQQISPAKNAMKWSYHTCLQEGFNNNTDLSMQGFTSSSNTAQQQQHSQIMQYQHQQLTPSQQLSIRYKRQHSILSAIRSQISRQSLSNDFGFKLIKNLEIGRLLVDSNFQKQQSKQIKMKTSVILNFDRSELHQMDLSWILQQYIEMKSWNMDVEQSRIISRIADNSYKMYIQFRKYSLMSLSRWVIVTVTAIKIQLKVYLLIRTCDQLTQQELVMGNYMSTVRMKKFHQTIQLTKREENHEKILMTILTVADYAGYCSKYDNLGMGQQLMVNITNFHLYLQSQVIARSQMNQSAINRLFILSDTKQQSSKLLSTVTKKIKFLEVDSSLTTFDQQRKKSQTISDISMDEGDSSFLQSEQKYGNSKSSQVIKYEKEQLFERPNYYRKSSSKQNSQHQLKNSHQIQNILYNDFIKEFSNFQSTDKGSEKLVELINSNLHQKYYLKHRFAIKKTYDSIAAKHNQDPNSDNWLLQNGKWKISGNQLIFTNQQILAKQKNVIKLILKQLSSNVMAGKNIMNMSLPVQIFEDKSFLQKLGEVFGLFPYYFNLAAQQKNIVKQITLVSQAFGFATTILPNIQKPFNPILGETYQCTVGGVSLCFEQVSHHPPVSAFYLKTDEYECYGSHNPNVDMGLNTAIARNSNPISVHFFETNTKYSGYSQDFEIGGLIFGQRTYKNSGRLNIFQQTNEILCQLSYGKNKKHIYQSPRKLKTGDIIGGVYKVSSSFTRRFKHAQWKNFQGIKYDEKIEQLAKIHGNWMGDFYIDGQKVRGMYDIVPFKPVKEIYVLPSDCSFRLDVFYKKMGDVKKSQEWKQVMENLQRKDRKLREEYTGHKGH